MTGTEYKAERKRLGLSQDRLAEHLLTSRRTVVRLENMNRVPPTAEYALRWLGYTLDGRTARATVSA